MCKLNWNWIEKSPLCLLSFGVFSQEKLRCFWWHLLKDFYFFTRFIVKFYCSVPWFLFNHVPFSVFSAAHFLLRYVYFKSTLSCQSSLRVLVKVAPVRSLVTSMSIIVWKSKFDPRFEFEGRKILPEWVLKILLRTFCHWENFSFCMSGWEIFGRWEKWAKVW